MAIFSRKNKSKAEKVNQSQNQINGESKPQPYRHIPKHAGSDSIMLSVGGSSREEAMAIMQASQQRINRTKSDNSLKNAGIVRSMAQNAMLHTPLSRSRSGRSSLAGFGFESMNSAPVFTTDPTAPPMPSISLSSHQSMPAWLTTEGDASAGPIWTLPKSRSYQHVNASGIPHNNYPDSGYDSTGLSSDMTFASPGEDRIWPTSVPTPISPDNSGLMPGVGVSNITDVAEGLPIHSFDEISLLDSFPLPARGQVANRRIDRSGHYDITSMVPEHTMCDSMSRPQCPSQISHFRERSHSQDRSRPSRRHLTKAASTKAARVLGEEVPLDIPLPHPFRRNDGGPQVTFEEPSPPTVAAVAESEENMVAAQYDVEEQPKRSSRQQRCFQLSSPLECVAARPPLSILEGFKVNKAGRVLDEEGDTIGELVEGDILDCVRQKVNASGEVLDDRGCIVGHVKVLPRQAHPNQEEFSQRADLVDTAPEILHQEEPGSTDPKQSERGIMNASTLEEGFHLSETHVTNAPSSAKTTEHSTSRPSRPQNSHLRNFSSPSLINRSHQRQNRNSAETETSGTHVSNDTQISAYSGSSRSPTKTQKPHGIVTSPASLVTSEHPTSRQNSIASKVDETVPSLGRYPSQHQEITRRPVKHNGWPRVQVNSVPLQRATNPTLLAATGAPASGQMLASSASHRSRFWNQNCLPGDVLVAVLADSPLDSKTSSLDERNLSASSNTSFSNAPNTARTRGPREPKPRTYFTHSGRISVQAFPPVQTPDEAISKADVAIASNEEVFVPADQGEAAVKQKTSRFSIGFPR